MSKYLIISNTEVSSNCNCNPASDAQGIVVLNLGPVKTMGHSAGYICSKIFGTREFSREEGFSGKFDDNEIKVVLFVFLSELRAIVNLSIIILVMSIDSVEVRL